MSTDTEPPGLTLERARDDKPAAHDEAPASTQDLSAKVRQVFSRLAMDKRRLGASQLQKRGVPAWVGEWVLEHKAPGTGPLEPQAARDLQDWAANTIPRAEDSSVIQFRMLQGEVVKVLTPVEVVVSMSDGESIKANLPVLDIRDLHISDAIVEENKDLLRLGMWGIVEMGKTEYGPTILDFKPMQGTINMNVMRKARERFSLAEWRDLLVTSMGFDPVAFSDEQKTYLLCRLLPLVERNMHLMELAPKGTGKSFIFQNINPHVRMVSGGNITPPALFFNNSNGRPGLILRYGVVVLDEVQTLKFSQPEQVVAGLKGFMANGSIELAGKVPMASECGIVMLANIPINHRGLPADDLFVRALPEFLQETAFLDRFRGIIPGWKLPKIMGRHLISADTRDAVGLKADSFGQFLYNLRYETEADAFVYQHVHLLGSAELIRHLGAVRDIAAGLLKMQFATPESASAEEFGRYCLEPAVELRGLVMDQLRRSDPEYAASSADGLEASFRP